MTSSSNNVEVHVPRPPLTGMFWAVSLFSLVGLIACFIAYTSFIDRGLRKDELFVPFIFGLLFVSGISALLVWQLSRIVGVFREAIRAPKIEPQSLPVYHAPPSLPNAMPPEPVSSISDHTTRSFDPVIYREAEKRRQRE